MFAYIRTGIHGLKTNNHTQTYNAMHLLPIYMDKFSFLLPNTGTPDHESSES